MIILRNRRYRAATLATGILLLVFVISYRDSFDTTSDRRRAAESVHLMGRSISRVMSEASFFQPIIQFTVGAHEGGAGKQHHALSVEEAMLYKRR